MSENIGIGGMEQLLIAMSATCTLLESAIADRNQHSLIGMCAIANELQYRARAVYEALTTDKVSRSNSGRFNLEESIDELEELITEAEAQVLMNKLVVGCSAMSCAGESKDDNDK